MTTTLTTRPIEITPTIVAPELRNIPMQQRSGERLNNILKAGQAILDRVGRDRLTTNMVVEEVGMSIGTFYRYFDDRVALLEAIAPLNRQVETFAEISALTTNAVIMQNNTQTVFHLESRDDQGTVWLQAGAKYIVTDSELVAVGPFTVIREGDRKQAQA